MPVYLISGTITYRQTPLQLPESYENMHGEGVWGRLMHELADTYFLNPATADRELQRMTLAGSDWSATNHSPQR